MNYHIYAIYSRIFDDIMALHGSGESAFGMSFHGNAAGAALRIWAIRNRLDVVPETLESSGKSWTMLNVKFAESSIDNITVHLTDDIPAVDEVDDVELEMPF